MFIVGLTGGIATGKSTVSAVFRENGVPVIDADVMARKVVEPGKKAWHKIKKEFGDGVFDANGHLDRAALGDVIFNDAEKRRKLNDITHPEIYNEIFWEAMHCLFQGHQFIVLDLPLLYETGSLIDYIHKIIVVTCEEDLQLQRLMERHSMSEERAKQRIASQMPLDKKCSMAQFTIENSGSVQDTIDQATRIVVLLQSSRAHWKVRAIAGILGASFLSLVGWLGMRYYLSSSAEA